MLEVFTHQYHIIHYMLGNSLVSVGTSETVNIMVYMLFNLKIILYGLDILYLSFVNCHWIYYTCKLLINWLDFELIDNKCNINRFWLEITWEVEYTLATAPKSTCKCFSAYITCNCFGHACWVVAGVAYQGIVYAHQK